MKKQTVCEKMQYLATTVPCDKNNLPPHPRRVSRIKGRAGGINVISLRGVNYRFWYPLGCGKYF